MVRRYTDGGDNPAWVDTTIGTITTTTRYVESIGGDLGASITGTERPLLSIADLHGDTATTIELPPTGDATAIGAWSDYDEYGQPKSALANNEPLGYGWLGAKQRSTTAATAGLTLMGDRLYNPGTGRFTSVDPERGGGANAYAYPNDQINVSDLDGRRWRGIRWMAKHIGFRTKNTNFTWRGRRPALHWGNHQYRIERAWRGKARFWHYNNDVDYPRHTVRLSVRRGLWDATRHAGRLGWRAASRVGGAVGRSSMWISVGYQSWSQTWRRPYRQNNWA